MKKKSQKYNYGECELCNEKMTEKRIKQDFWIRGKLIVIDNVTAGVCPRCGSKVVNSETGKRLAAVLQNPRKWSKASLISVPVVELRP
jgi:YgiT-type zinc finger domain-containing protein